ncbi:MAG: hypothetical protein AAGF67_04285, partial [Verrucomicrobiota bacterium]
QGFVIEGESSSPSDRSSIRKRDETCMPQCATTRLKSLEGQRAAGLEGQRLPDGKGERKHQGHLNECPGKIVFRFEVVFSPDGKSPAILHLNASSL